MYIYIHLSLPFATYSRGGEARSLSSSDGGSCDPVERVFFIKSLSGVPYTRTYFLNYFTFLPPSSSSSFFFILRELTVFLCEESSGRPTSRVRWSRLGSRSFLLLTTSTMDTVAQFRTAVGSMPRAAIRTLLPVIEQLYRSPSRIVNKSCMEFPFDCKEKKKIDFIACLTTILL